MIWIGLMIGFTIGMITMSKIMIMGFTRRLDKLGMVERLEACEVLQKLKAK